MMKTIIALLLALSVSGTQNAIDHDDPDGWLIQGGAYFCLSSPSSINIPDSTVVSPIDPFNFPAGHWDLDKGCYINHVEWDKHQQINSQDLFISEPINENSAQIDSTEYATCVSDLDELQTQLGLLSARIDELEGGGCDPVTAAKCSTCGRSRSASAAATRRSAASSTPSATPARRHAVARRDAQAATAARSRPRGRRSPCPGAARARRRPS